MPSLDIFNNNAFSLSNLTDAIETAPYKPKMLGSLGLFEDVRIRTTTAYVEKKNGRLSVLRTANRGTMMDVHSTKPRTLIPFVVPHVPYFQQVLADDVQNIRAFGSETELQSLAAHINEQLIGMKDDHEVTHEYHRVGALKGVVLDADGTRVIANILDAFNLTQTVIPIYGTTTNLGNSMTEIVRTLADLLGNEGFDGLLAICGNNYFDGVVNHASMVAAYDRWRDGQFFRESHLGPAWFSAAAAGFMYQNIMFINYRGRIGDLTFIGDNEAYYVPRGIRGLFQEIIAPADFAETVNTLGRKFYAKQERIKFDKGVELHTQSNVLAMCTRPDVIIKSTYAAEENPSSSSA